MPNLAAPAGASPSILSLLAPVAVSPVAPVDGAPGPSFADIVAGLTVPPELPPTALPPGQTLPVERPEIAASEPAPIDETDPLLGGCGWTPEPLLPTPEPMKPIARFDPDGPALLPVPMTPKLVTPEAAVEPDLPPPARGVFRSPLRVAVLASAPQAVIARATQPGPIAAPELPVAKDEVAPETREQAEPEFAISVAPSQPEPAATPMAVPAPRIVLAPVAPEGMPSPNAELAAPVAALPIAAARTEPTASVEAPPAATPLLQNSSESQPDTQQQPQPQPQPQPKPAQAPAAAAELRIVPELARQVAQMIQPALERVAEPQPVPAIPVDATLPVSAAPAPQPVAAPAPVQTATFQSAPIDLGRAGWVEAMIERIAEMPQVERREAQIKLLPDMLGKVEVTLIERDERVHVTLNAETVQARQMLTEAAPRLQELAEARGLRLGQTEIGGGTSQDRRPTEDQTQTQTPLRPRSAQADEADETSTPTGDRIA